MIKSLFDYFPELAALKGQICWGVSNGYGSVISCEFGDPHLTIREPLTNITTDLKKVRDALSRRNVFIEGQWFLWINMCSWKLFNEKTLLCTSNSSTEQISNSISVLNGQKLIDALINPTDGTTQFIFDLGSHVLSEPYEKIENLKNYKSEDNWLIYDKTSELKVISYNGKDFNVEV